MEKYLRFVCRWESLLEEGEQVPDHPTDDDTTWLVPVDDFDDDTVIRVAGEVKCPKCDGRADYASPVWVNPRVYSVQAKPPTYPRLIVEDFGREWWIALGPEPDMFTDEIKVGPFRSEGSARIYWQRTANTPLQTAAQT